MKKRVFYTEAAYILGLLLLALGTALTVFGGYGVSAVVAPAYILHLKLSEVLPWFSFGFGEYALQGMVLILLMLCLRKARLIWLYSFVTAIVYGIVLDVSMTATSLLPDGVVLRIGSYLLGLLLCSAGVGLLLRGYFPPAAYELFIKELSYTKNWAQSKVKTIYDISSLAVSVGMSLLFWQNISGIGIGTLAGALLNGPLIHLFGCCLDRGWVFRDRFAMRAFFGKVRKNNEQKIQTVNRTGCR